MSCDFFQLATPGVQGLQAYPPGKPIAELQREYGLSDVIKLASNESPLGPSPQAVQAVQLALTELARYPDGNGFQLKQALAQQLNVSMPELILGNGSNELIELIARTFVTAEQAIIFSEYAFAVYPLVTQAIGAQAIVTPACEWGHDLNAMYAAITDDTRLIFIANPNNPTGTWVNKTTLEAFLTVVPEQILVVVDEAYFEYVTEVDYPNSLVWLKRYPNLIVLRTFSKAYGLAGLRVGYAVCHEDIAELLNRVRQPFNVNSLALVAASASLTDYVHLETAIALNHQGQQQLTEAFEQLGLSYIPSVGNFISVNVGEGATVYQALLREGIITRPLGNMPEHLRISIGLPEENDRLIHALSKVV
ncbi:MAG: histidinol-phosphate transaminase [Pseudomonadota bacterium]|nr:histidinol-phosphate transaminase [Pseudomonadota bacterium]